MSTSSETSKTRFSDSIAKFLTSMIVAIASGLVNAFLAVMYRVFLFFVIVIGVSTVIALLAGGTALTAVLFGKIVAAVFFLFGFCIVFAMPARRFFDETAAAVALVFAAKATPAV